MLGRRCECGGGGGRHGVPGSVASLQSHRVTRFSHLIFWGRYDDPEAKQFAQSHREFIADQGLESVRPNSWVRAIFMFLAVSVCLPECRPSRERRGRPGELRHHTGPGTFLCKLPGKELEGSCRTRSGLKGTDWRDVHSSQRDLDAKITSLLSKVNIASLSNTNS